MDTRVITQFDLGLQRSIFNQQQIQDESALKLDDIANDIYDNELYARNYTLENQH